MNRFKNLGKFTRNLTVNQIHPAQHSFVNAHYKSNLYKANQSSHTGDTETQVTTCVK